MKVIYAVSGGIDSMCMADMFCHKGGDGAIAHCNFHLRAGESDADAELVRRWAGEHGVEYFHADFDTEAYARRRKISIEMAARELRYGWFAELASKHGYDAVAVAHNANDNAETFLLNLLRGTGGKGLRGMRREGVIPGTTVPLLRPLLAMSREDIEKYVSEHAVPFREDRTNSETIYKRNLLRHKVLPVFKELNPSYLETLRRDMGHIAVENDIAEDYFLEARDHILAEGRISIPALLSYKHWKYLLHRLTEPFSLSEEGLEALIRLITDSSATFAGKTFGTPTHRLVTTAGAILILAAGAAPARDEGLVIAGPGIYHCHESEIRIELTGIDPSLQLIQEAGVLIADADALPFPVTVRGWKDGDWMRPFGMGGRRKKLSDIFTDLKLSLPEKQEIIVLHSPLESDSSHVCAILGHRIDEALRVTKGSTKKILKISII